MTSPRQLRALVVAEIADVLAASLIAQPIPLVLPLLVATSLMLGALALEAVQLVG